MDRYAVLNDKLKNRKTVSIANLIVTQSPIMLRAFESADCILLEMGANIFWLSDDLACMKSGFETLKNQVEEIFNGLNR